jgi:dTDP-4-amino-4,6-dideoxygalactose transaminase
MTSDLRIPFVDLRAQYHAIADEINEAIRGVLERADFILGEAVEQFEIEFASYIGARHAVGVGSGLAALELALRAYGIGPGDEVITTANTYIATVLAIRAVGARPVLVDADPGTYNLAPSALNAAITPRTRAVMPVHLYGQPADLDALLPIAARHHLLVIEDAAQAHGARYRGRRVGGFGHASGFSFYPGKNLGAYGDGGMVVTNDGAVAERLRQLRNYGQRVKYYHDLSGTNSRLDSLQAAFLRVKLRHLDQWNAARRAHAALYHRCLEGLPVLRPSTAAEAEHIYHLYVIQTDGRDQVRSALQAAHIETGIHYPVPIHLQKACADLGYGSGAFPVTEAAAARILSLPMFAELSEAQIERVVHALARALRLQPSCSGVGQ